MSEDEVSRQRVGWGLFYGITASILAVANGMTFWPEPPLAFVFALIAGALLLGFSLGVLTGYLLTSR